MSRLESARQAFEVGDARRARRLLYEEKVDAGARRDIARLEALIATASELREREASRRWRNDMTGLVESAWSELHYARTHGEPTAAPRPASDVDERLEDFQRRLRAMERELRQLRSAAIAEPMPVPEAERISEPVAAPAAPPPPAPPPPPSAGLASLLDMGIASVEELGVHPLSDAVPVEETVVPIESLIYRGEAALQRARELRDDLRPLDAPPREALEELYDLLDLVTE
jgi:hypothetical protein